MFKNNNSVDLNYIASRISQLNFLFISLITTITIIGLVMLYSAAGGNMSPWATAQMTRFLFFFPIMLLIAIIDIKFWYKYAYLAYFAALILLIVAEFRGYTAMGATRWVKLGFFKLQPSEFMKICMLLALARYFHNIHAYKIANPLFLAVPLIMVLLPVTLILKQPDLGTAIILFASTLAIFFTTGIRKWKFIVSGLGFFAMIPFVWNFLKTYQKQRILTFLNPESDPLGSGYNIIQSKIAIGSGGFFGKGLLSGSQSQLSFLPEKQTDFIFTMIAEELGFLGSLIVITLYAILIFRSLFIARHCRNHFGRLLAVGLATFLFLHIFINIAMVLGLIPVVGAPLPLVSYGGTMLIVTMISLGLLLNIELHKDSKIDRVS
jgi:rod shape determining protein RodA